MLEFGHLVCDLDSCRDHVYPGGPLLYSLIRHLTNHRSGLAG